MERNRHHLLYPKRQYRGLQKELRQHPGLVIPGVWIPIHKQLHAELLPPPKPSHDLTTDLLNNLNNRSLTAPLDGLKYTVEHLTNIEREDTQKLATHLLKQLGYLVLGVEHEVSQMAT